VLRKFILLPLLFTGHLFSQESITEFTKNDFYAGFGWKTFQLGSIDNGATAVNGDGVLLITGKYFPKYDLKLELSASVLGYLSYKETDSTGFVVSYNTDIDEADYMVSAAYGGGKRNDRLYMFPHLLLGAGVKTITYDSVDTITLPMVQAGVGFSVRNDPIEFFVKYYYDFLFNTQKFTTANGVTIDIHSANGSLETGINFIF